MGSSKSPRKIENNNDSRWRNKIPQHQSLDGDRFRSKLNKSSYLHNSSVLKFEPFFFNDFYTK